MKIITFLTDFGIDSTYVSQMKGVALSITDAKLVDISHEISPLGIERIFRSDRHHRFYLFCRGICSGFF